MVLAGAALVQYASMVRTLSPEEKRIRRHPVVAGCAAPPARSRSHTALGPGPAAAEMIWEMWDKREKDCSDVEFPSRSSRPLSLSSWKTDSRLM